MNTLIKRLLSNRLNLILLGALMLIVVGGFFGFRVLQNRTQVVDKEVEEAELTFDPEGPYALLVPRKDGNALILSLKRTASYDKISYELAYNAEGIDRGVVGDVNTADKKSEYEQEILFGTCSKNVCKYDKGVSIGTLTLRITRGKEKYKMVTKWHIQKISEAQGKLVSGDGHFFYTAKGNKLDFETTAYSINNDLTGVPKLPADTQVIGKVYSVNIPTAKELNAGEIRVELSENAPEGAKIGYYQESANEWKLLDSKIEGSKLSVTASGAGIYAVLVTSDK